MPNDNKMPMPMEQASYETSGPAPTSGKQDEIEIAESVLPEGARVERETARSEMGVGGGKADKWRGGGDYYYEVTPQGIKVTGGDKAKTLTGGKSTMLTWADTDPKTMKMIQAILASRTDKDSELGATYSAPEERRELDMNPGQALAAAKASDPKLAAMLDERDRGYNAMSKAQAMDDALRMGTEKLTEPLRKAESETPSWRDRVSDAALSAMKKYGYSERD